ncbi:substrate-binding periplasmic protein [Actinomycetota bacterium]
MMDKTIKTLKISTFIFLSIIIIIIYAVALTSCDTDATNGTGDPGSETQRLTIYSTRLLVGSDTTYPPFEYLEDGKTIGFDIDIASEIARRLERELEIVPITWDSTYDIPKDIRIDMIISAVSRAEDKEELVDFSDPYYIMEYILVTLSEAELILREDLKNKKIGMLTNKPDDFSTQYLKDFSVEIYSDVILMIDGLKNKDIEGMIISVPLGKSIIEENNGLFKIIEKVKSEREYNIVFLEGSPLKDEVNSILEEMYQDGAYQEIFDKWFTIIK